MLDRLVGYKASPVLWKTVKKGLSAGRVQTVALRLIVEREREIRAFKPVEYWTIEALLEKDGAAVHRQAASDRRQEGGDPQSGRSASASSTTLKGAQDVRRHRGQAPRAPQESVGAVHDVARCSRKRRRSCRSARKRTMRVAQDLYEGIELGAEGAVGLITYMRTDSTRVAESAAQQARDYLRTLFGEEFVCEDAAALRRRQGEEHAGRARSDASHGSDAPSGRTSRSI